LNSSDSNLLLSRSASGLLDNILSNKYNGIKNIIKLPAVKVKAADTGSDHIGIIFDIVIDNGTFKNDYEKDPTEAQRQLEILMHTDKAKESDTVQLKLRIENIIINQSYENKFKFETNPLNKPTYNSNGILKNR
jgi:hypothetical protein